MNKSNIISFFFFLFSLFYLNLGMSVSGGIISDFLKILNTEAGLLFGLQ